MLSTTPQVFYCATCMRYIAPTGKGVGYESDDVIVWIECEYCLIQRLEREAEEEEQRRWEEEWRTPRECELEGCGELFVPGTRWQAYCCDEHRWRAHRARRKAA